MRNKHLKLKEQRCENSYPTKQMYTWSDIATVGGSQHHSELKLYIREDGSVTKWSVLKVFH